MQRARTLPDVLRVAGDGLVGLGLRAAVFQIEEPSVVLRFLGPVSERAPTNRAINRPLVGLRAPLDRCGYIQDALAQRGVVRVDASPLARFVELALGQKSAAPPSAGVVNIVAPLFVAERPWGVLSITASSFGPEESEAIAVLAAQVASAIEIAELTEALQSAREELVARERTTTIGEIAATLAQEVRNPLGVLFNSVTSLRRLLPLEVDPAKRSDADVVLSIVAEETERLNGIVTDLLEVARPWIMRTGEASLRSIVRAVVEDVPCVPGGGAADVRLELADLPPVDIDARMIHQALLALVMCAVESTPQGVIRVATRIEHGDKLSYACVDILKTNVHATAPSPPRASGSGAPARPSSAPAAVSTTRPAVASLELALVKRVVEAHRGELEVQNDTEGSTFTMRIPIPHWDDSHVTLKRDSVAPNTLRNVGTLR